MDTVQVIGKLKPHKSELFIIEISHQKVLLYNAHFNNTQLLIENLSPSQHVLFETD